jgi:hypothetical protein
MIRELSSSAVWEEHKRVVTSDPIAERGAQLMQAQN